MAELAVRRDRPTRCTWRDRRFVEPCWALDEELLDRNPRKQSATGFYLLEYTNTETRKPSRTLAVYQRRGKGSLILNHCPFCGVLLFEETPGEEVANG